MSILQKLTIRNLRANRRRTAVTIVGVMLSSALILAVVGLVTSFQKMMLNVAIAETGDYEEMYQEVPRAALEYITQNQHVKSFFYSEPVTAERIDAAVLETYAAYPQAAYGLEVYERLDVLPEQPHERYNVYVDYDQPRNYEQIRDQLLATLSEVTGEDINVRTNSNLLRAYGVVGDVALESLVSVAVIIVAIIVVTSIFVIRNSFSISATERARQFGMLSSVGATPRQIRHSVIFEGVVIATLGIPLGILLGVVVVAILVLVVNALLGELIVAQIEFSLPLWVFPLVLLLSFVSIMLSALAPAIRASRRSAIESIRSTSDIKIKPRRLRTPKLIAQCFGIGGVIASKNLKRSRKKYRTTVISIVLSVATFIGLSSFLTYGKKSISLEYHESRAEIVLYGGDAEFYEELVDQFALTDYAYYQMLPTRFAVSVYLMNHDAFKAYAKSLGVASSDYRKVAIMNAQGLTANDGGYVVTELEGAKEGQTYAVELVKADCADEQSCTSEAETTLEIPLTKLTTARPLGFEASMQPTIYLPDDYAGLADVQLGSLEVTYPEFIGASIANLDEVDAYLSDFNETQTEFDYSNYQNVKETYNQMRRMILLMEIFLYGFIAVVTLIGVTNIFNTITTNVALRAREFAMLKSIGMTSSEFNRMVRLESLFYSGKALMIGLPLGLLLSYAFYQSIASSIDFGFIFPWVAILISIVAVAILISVIMRYSVREVEKQNIIETIRSENI